MQELQRFIQDRNSIRQGRKETKVCDENRTCEDSAEPGRNTALLAGALRQFPFRITVNRDKTYLLGY